MLSETEHTLGQGAYNFRFIFESEKPEVAFVIHTSSYVVQVVTNRNLTNLKKPGSFIFLVHGWGESMYSPYYQALTDAYYQRGSYSIVHTDWSKLAFQAYNVAIENTLIAGHSLGAHVAGVAGETVYRHTRRRVGRITGLDPAGPLYEGAFTIAKKKLSKNDAKMVDIVHTDDGLFGSATLKGTVNFYPNGGTALQPGCPKSITLTDVAKTFETLFVEPFPHVATGDIEYYLYNKQHWNRTVGRHHDYINRKYPLKVLIHGWTEHNYVKWYKNVAKAYMAKGLYNVIAVDWSLKGDTDYLTASRIVKAVGNKIAEFLVNLHQRQGVPYKSMHIISHSLGCHVAGCAGKQVFKLTRRKIARITALDPAAPIFDLAMVSNIRLSKEDAGFVDVTHTDGGMLGFNFPIGTVDFFPNGGTAVQPGCSLLKLDIKYEDCKQLKKMLQLPIRTNPN
ncbi:hypothetical protein Trydic_g12286 [Trypoxylus dichotomus]